MGLQDIVESVVDRIGKRERPEKEEHEHQDVAHFVPVGICRHQPERQHHADQNRGMQRDRSTQHRKKHIEQSDEQRKRRNIDQFTAPVSVSQPLADHTHEQQHDQQCGRVEQEREDKE